MLQAFVNENLCRMENIIVFSLSNFTCLPVTHKAQGNLWLEKGIFLSDGFHFSTIDFLEDCKAIILLHIYRAHPEEKESVSGNTFLPANFTSLIQSFKLI